jgi:hypothetical protein
MIATSNNRHIETLTPHFELLNRGSPKSVTRGEHRAPAALLDKIRQLSGGSCFSSAVDSNDGYHG